MALCECGCGKDAGVYKTTTNGHTKGQPKKFLRGHSYRNPLKIPTLPTQLCECGCGMDAGFYVARPTKPRRFIAGHQAKTANAILHALPKVRKTHCPRGHEKTPENTSNGGGCKTCARLRFHERQLPNHCIHGHEKTLENTTKTGACKVCAAIHMKRRYGLSRK